MLSRAIEVYYALLTASVLGLALLVASQSHVLPYGNYAAWPFSSLISIAVLLATAGVRSHWLRRMLVTSKLFTMKWIRIPRRESETYLGHAFAWNPKHAERLYYLSSQGIEAPERVQSVLGGNTLLHGLGLAQEKPLMIADVKRPQHMLITGGTGSGKTRAMELQLLQFIEKGEPVVIVDPKGDMRLINLVRQACSEYGRPDAFRLFALPWARTSVAYSPLTCFSTPSEIADRLIAILPPASGDADPFRGFQWGAIKAVAQALYLSSLPMTLARVLDGLRDMESLTQTLVATRFANLKSDKIADTLRKYEARITAKEMKRSPELDDLFGYLKLNKDYYLKMVGSFMPQLERLCAGPKREILSPEPEETSREILTWPAIDNQKLVVYFYLGSLHGEESAKAVGKMLLLDCMSYVANRYSYQGGGKNLISLVADEFHSLVSPSFMKLMAEGRGASLACVVATQTTAQVEQELGSRAAVDELLTQNWVHLQFRASNPREAEDFSKMIGKRLMRIVGESYRYEPAFFNSGLNQVDDFRAQHTIGLQQKEADLVPPWLLTQLATFHFFARVGARCFKGRVPLLSHPTSTLTEDLQKGVAL